MISIFWNNLRRIGSSPVRLAILLLAPLLFMQLLIPSDWDVPIKVCFIDQDGSELTATLRQRLADEFQLVALPEEEILPSLLADRIQYGLVAREGFGQAFLTGANPQLEAHSLEGTDTTALVQSCVNSALNSLAPVARAAAGDAATFHQGLRLWSASSIAVNPVQTEQANIGRSLAVLGFLVQFMLYMSVVTTGLILEERSNGALYRIFSAPVTARQYMAAHLLSSLAVGLVQVTVVFLALRYWMQVYFGRAFLSLLLLFGLFAAVCICLGLLLTSYCQKPKQAYLAIMLLTTPLVMLGGCYWPRSYMPDLLVRISNLVPTTWILEGARKLLEGGSLLGSAGEIGILVAFAAVFFAGGVLRRADVSR